MERAKMIAICEALVDITARECCVYGFSEEIADATAYLNESISDTTYKDRWKRLDHLLTKTIKLMKEKYDHMPSNQIEADEKRKVWQELQTVKNIHYLMYTIEHTNNIDDVDVIMGGNNNAQI